jgi:hypothetical protein
MAEAEDTVRKHISVMDGIEGNLVDAQSRLKVSSVGEISIRANECDALRKEYKFWANKLANILGCPIHPLSWIAGQGGINVDVSV